MTEVRPRGKQSKLATSDTQAKAWRDAIPDIDDIFQCKSYDELSKIVNDWLGEGETPKESDHTSAGTSTSESDSSSSSQSTSNTSGYKNIDDAFADLMSE